MKQCLDLKADPNFAPSKSYTPLTRAKTVEIAELLVSKGARYSGEITRLPEAPMLELWLKSGAKPTAKALFECAREKDEKACKLATLVLSQGLNVNQADPDGDTALAVAVGNDKPHLVDLLLARGALVNPEQGQKSPLEVAATGRKIDPGGCLRSSLAGGRRE